MGSRNRVHGCGPRRARPTKPRTNARQQHPNPTTTQHNTNTTPTQRINTTNKTVYTAANISGGHLNPAVTISTFVCGFYPALHSLLYIILQVAGGICGSLLAAGLIPGARLGMGAKGPGCFEPALAEDGANSISRAQLFGWEVLMTFTLISVVYACGIAKPGHGSFTPLIVGLTLTACAGTGGKWTGAALNPARVIGPAAVFGCSKRYWWIYILAELLAAVLACAVFAYVSGWGPLAPMKSTKEYGLTHVEAVHMWLTGSPPKRLRGKSGDNVEDMVERLEKTGQVAKGSDSDV